MITAARFLLLPVFFIGCFSTVCQAQNNKHFKASATLNTPLLTTPGLQAGLQPGLLLDNKFWGFNIDYAFAFSRQHQNFSNIHYRRYGAELKKYFYQDETSKAYASLQGTYANRTFNNDSTGFIYFKNDRTEFNYESAYIKSPVLTIAAKVGRQFNLGNKMFIDAFAGVGWRSIHTTFLSTTNLQQQSTNWRTIRIWPPAYRYAATINRLHATAGVRFGYTF